jgi:hypothetical protein
VHGAEIEILQGTSVLLVLVRKDAPKVGRKQHRRGTISGVEADASGADAFVALVSVLS